MSQTQPLLPLPAVPTIDVTLRPYQVDGVEAMRAAIREGTRSLLVVAPTGSGKTVCFSSIAVTAIGKGRRALILAHRRELIGQAYDKLTLSPEQGGYGVPEDLVGVVMAADPRRRLLAPIQIASVDTLRSRLANAGAALDAAALGLPDFDFIIIDEAHRALAAGYRAVCNAFPRAVVLGFTATPWRLDGRGLDEMFDRLLVLADVESLVVGGYLARSRVYSHKVKADLSRVHTGANGDYDERELAEAVDREGLVGNIVDHWLTHAGYARTFVFAASVEHSRHIAARFVARGIPALHVDGATAAGERDAALRRLRAGEVLVLCNYGIFAEGTDVPDVKCVTLARPTKSETLYRQAVGRGARTIPGLPDVNTYVVLDHAGSSLRFGLPEDAREYKLDGRARRAADPDNTPTKECPGCWRVIASFERECPECGYLFGEDAGGRAAPKERDGELAEVEVRENKKRRELSASIERVARGADEARGWPYGTTNRAIVTEFGKPRKEMSLLELRAVLRWLTDGLFAKQYPVPGDDRGRLL